jgi:hypothetical protein
MEIMDQFDVLGASRWRFVNDIFCHWQNESYDNSHTSFLFKRLRPAPAYT